MVLFMPHHIHAVSSGLTYHDAVLPEMFFQPRKIKLKYSVHVIKLLLIYKYLFGARLQKLHTILRLLLSGIIGHQ